MHQTTPSLITGAQLALPEPFKTIYNGLKLNHVKGSRNKVFLEKLRCTLRVFLQQSSEVNILHFAYELTEAERGEVNLPRLKQFSIVEDLRFKSR